MGVWGLQNESLALKCTEMKGVLEWGALGYMNT